MSILDQNPVQDFTPQKIKFSDIYKYGAKSDSVSSTAINDARQALSKAGYSASDISRIFSDDQKIPVVKMREIAEHLNKAGVHGFTQSPSVMMRTYLAKERVKARNINRRMHENMLESRKDNIDTGYGKAVTSLNNIRKNAASSLNNYGKGSTSSLSNLDRGPSPSPSPSSHINLPF